MKKIIVYKHHHATDYFDASTEAAETGALKEIFKRNKEMTCYHNLEDTDYNEEVSELKSDLEKLKNIDPKKMPSNLQHVLQSRPQDILCLEQEIKELESMKKLFDLCVEGKPKALKQFLLARKDCDSEGLEFVKLEFYG